MSNQETNTMTNKNVGVPAPVIVFCGGGAGSFRSGRLLLLSDMGYHLYG